MRRSKNESFHVRIPLLSAATAAMVAMGAPASASIVLTYSDGTFVNDIDAQPQAITGVPEVDIETFDSTMVPLDIRLFGPTEPGMFEYSILQSDFNEIAGLSPVSTAANVTLIDSDTEALAYEYSASSMDTAGDVLASFEVNTGMVDLQPGDELSDIIVADTDNALGIWDPAKETDVIELGVDVQDVPLPAGVILLAGALGGLGVMRRRNAA